VFLCVTGAEALYADLGHFGPAPIRAAWNFVVFPSLILNYAGQTALVLNGQSIEGNIFFALCPDVLLTPYVLLATVATIIASQSIITGAFSMTRQAIQLGALPRLKIVQTSEEGYGQIYVGAVNWLLMIVTVALTIGFGKSDNLAAAYGIAVSLTMLMTSVLLFIAMREIWNWSVPLAGAVAGGFLIVDAAFFAANLVKVFDGGYVPLVLAGMICVAMWVWRRGTNAVRERVHATETPIDQLMVEVESQAIPRVPGTAVFLSRAVGGAPPVLVWHLKHNRSLHAFVYVLHIDVASTPRVNPANRLVVKEAAPNFWRAEAHYGFMEHPDVTTILRESSRVGCPLDLSDVTYFVGHETIVQRDDGKGLPHWMVMVFAAMTRNASRINDFLDLPTDQVVEIGRQVAI
jgi:KUP system potassium uptake protein